MKLFCTKCKKVYELNWEGTMMGGQNGAKCKCGYPLSRRGSARSPKSNEYNDFPEPPKKELLDGVYYCVGANKGKKAD